jgi:hypothetical protein
LELRTVTGAFGPGHPFSLSTRVAILSVKPIVCSADLLDSALPASVCHQISGGRLGRVAVGNPKVEEMSVSV